MRVSSRRCLPGSARRPEARDRIQMARVLKLAYQLRSHRLGGWTLDRWGVTLTWGAALVIMAQWLWRGRPVLPGWHWLVLALLILGGLAQLVLRGWASRSRYVVFVPQSGRPAPASRPLAPEEKLPVRATGRFEVQTKTRFLADLQAYWRTYASREHAVLAIETADRFLGLGRTPDDDLGMWYLFLRPEVIQGIVAGQLTYGIKVAPALCITYRFTPPAIEGKRPPQPATEIAYLAFGDEAGRDAVWADLLADRA